MAIYANNKNMGIEDMGNGVHPKEAPKEEKMGREKFEELTTRQEGLEVLDTEIIVSDEEKLEGEIENAAKNALNNNAIRVVVFRPGPLTDDMSKEDVIRYYVTPEYAEKTLPSEKVERIRAKKAL